MWMTDTARSGSPSTRHRACIRRSVGTPNRPGMADSKLVWPSSQLTMASRPRWARRSGRSDTPSGSGSGSAPDLGGRLALGDEGRVHAVEHDRPVDDTTSHVAPTGQVVHHVEENLLEDGAQPAGAGATQKGLLGHSLESVVGELELDAVEFEHPAVLLDERVLGLDEDPDQRVLVEARDCAHHGQPANEFRDEPELDEVLG